jgi:hypothetical protein
LGRSLFQRFMEVAETERCEKIQHVLGLREIELAGDSAWPAPTNKKLPTTSANKKTSFVAFIME